MAIVMLMVIVMVIVMVIIKIMVIVVFMFMVVILSFLYFKLKDTLMFLVYLRFYVTTGKDLFIKQGCKAIQVCFI